MVGPTSDEEEKYFRKLDMERREELRRKLAKAASELQQEHAIAEHLATDDESIPARLRALGFDGDTSRVFDLMPLIHVAWADGRIQKHEREAIFKVLELRGIERDSEAFHLIESLLEVRPPEAVLEESLRILRDLVSRGGERPQSIVDLCVVVARASGGFLGLGSKMDPAEQQVIAHVAEVLGEQAQSEFQRLLGTA